MPYPHITITPIPDTEPDAVPALWNTRYAEIDENFDYFEDFVSGFKSSVITNGHQKLPSGLILQWGTTLAGKMGTSVASNFPTPFQFASFGVFGIHLGTDSSVNIIADSAFLASKTEFALRSNYVANDVICFFIAIGK